jgi:aspartyl-tRNA(Asn)/glutamyl-tRNA(Gln) amidotransferase subunit A
MSALHTLTLTALREKLAAREVSVEQAVTACLERIEATEPAVHALLHVDGLRAREQARQMDAAGPDADKPLWGVPVTVKDVLTTRDMPTTCGSRMLQEFQPFYDAHAVQRLRRAGAVILGKNNMDEFAMGSSTENSAYGPTRNPWDTGAVPGGSSGGSAASVAAGQCFASVGTDTGGSIRLPASFCGCVGIKPTYGRVSRYGLVAYGSSLDQAGPLTRSVADAAAVLQAIAGHDPRDSTSAERPVPDFAAGLDREDLKGVRVGMPKEYFGEGVSAEVDEACRAAIATAEELGAEVVPVSLAYTDYGIAAYYIIVMAEASSNLARFDGVRYGHRDKAAAELKEMYTASRTQGFGDEVQRRIMLGTYVLSAGYYDAYYRKAAQVRRLIRQDFEQALKQCDVLLGPVCPSTAFGLGDKVDDPLQMYLMDVYTTGLNMSGLPGLSLPAGLGKDSGLPVGLQVIGPAFGEDAVLGVAAALERALPPLPEPAGLAGLKG